MFPSLFQHPLSTQHSVQAQSSRTMVLEKVVIVYGGDLAHDVAKKIGLALEGSKSCDYVLQCAGGAPKKLLELDFATHLFVFVLQTIENAQPTEEGGKTVRFFKRKTHPEDLLKKEDGSSLRYTVLGLGDSNLLLDRQTTGPKDCNQVAEALDRRLEELGGTRIHDLGLDDERSGLTNVERWIEGVQGCIAGVLANAT